MIQIQFMQTKRSIEKTVMENESKTIGDSRSSTVQNAKFARVVLGLRLGALVATTSAAMVMGLNKQTKNMVVAVVGTTPIYQELTAKFQHTPAFVYFVIANAIASAYSLFVLLLKLFIREKSYAVWVHVADTVIVTMVATGAAAAASMAALGKKGNDHARWSPICNKFETFCAHGGSALVSSFIGVLLLLILAVVSTVRLHKHIAANHNFNQLV